MTDRRPPGYGETPQPPIQPEVATASVKQNPAPYRLGAPPPPVHGPGYPGGASPGPVTGVPLARRTNGLATAALVCGLLFGPLGIIFGHISINQIKKTGEGGKGMAVAGLVLGYFSLASVIVWLVVGIVAGDAVNSTDGGQDSTPFVVEDAQVGDCLHKMFETMTIATCGTPYSTHRISKKTYDSSDCSGEWVRSKSSSPPIVLCLTSN